MKKKICQEKINDVIRSSGWFNQESLYLTATHHGDMQISNDTGFVGNVDSFFVSTLDLDHIVLMIKAMIQSYKNGVYHGNEAGTRKAQNTIRVALGFDEIEE